MAKVPKTKKVESLTHDKARRINVPTAELQSLADQQEELAPRPPKHYPRARPLPKGETRERDPDLDPQIVWNGVKISLTKDQVAQLAETGTVEIGDAQLVWRGKDRQDWSDLIVNVPMLYVQEKVHPKAIIDDLKRQTDAARETASDAPDLFADFNGLTDPEARAEFYQHAMYWQNRMILGDSLQVMASLAERETLRGKVQCIYFDPPYGIKFNSNWQVSTLSRDVKDGKQADVTREPEQVKAFRDTWKDEIHSYLTYLRDRLIVARELLTDSGSIFVQIGDENVHLLRGVLDEVFGQDNCCAQLVIAKTAGQSAELVAGTADYVLWYSRRRESVKFRAPLLDKSLETDKSGVYRWVLALDGAVHPLAGSSVAEANSTRIFRYDNLTSQRPPGSFPVRVNGREFGPGKGYWKTGEEGMGRLLRASRIGQAKNSLTYVRFLSDFRAQAIGNIWNDTGTGSFTDEKIYVVQSGTKAVARCVLMVTDPGDLVLDPTCGSGTTAYAAEQWGRRWITIDTSRVALALARTRLMSARYPYYVLADSPDGHAKEQEITGRIQPDTPTHKDVRQGFVYERVPHITLKSIANNAEIDVIWETWQRTLEPLREALNARLKRNEPWEEWQIPRESGDPWPELAAKQHAVASDKDANEKRRLAALAKINKELGRKYTLEMLPEKPFDAWTDEEAIRLHAAWWQARLARQKEIDASIERAADVEFLYDKPYPDNSKVRVAGPFTVESLSPHRVVTSRDDSLGNELAAVRGEFQRGPKNVPEADFGVMVLEHLRSAGVHQKDKKDAIRFSPLEPWPGAWIAAEGRYTAEDGRERRAAVFIGPEFGTVTRADLTAAAREASEARFDVLIACAFSYDAHAGELSRLGPLPILKARMNPDLHMAGDLKNTGKGNLFVVFGEPDIDILEQPDGQIRVKVNGIDVFDPATGDIRSDDTSGIACWFIDTDYNEESFFVRHAYFLGANDPYGSLKTALKAEIDEDAWASLYSDTSRPFPRPETGRIAVKVINHFGDEVLKVFGV
jgi:adenine-specific DNA-methyltransferase